MLISTELPRTPVAVILTRNDEFHITDVNDAADIVHRVFPFAPIPMRIEVGEGEGIWLVDLDPATTHLVADGTWFEISTHDPRGFVTLEVPQP